MPDKEAETPSTADDSLVAHSLWEAKWIVAIWCIAFLWVVGYCIGFGYGGEGQPIPTVWGMPAWVFWGIALPWGVAAVVSSWFALACIADEPLSRERVTGDWASTNEADVEQRQDG